MGFAFISLTTAVSVVAFGGTAYGIEDALLRREVPAPHSHTEQLHANLHAQHEKIERQAQWAERIERHDEAPPQSSTATSPPSWAKCKGSVAEFNAVCQSMANKADRFTKGVEVLEAAAGSRSTTILELAKLTPYLNATWRQAAAMALVAKTKVTAVNATQQVPAEAVKEYKDLATALEMADFKTTVGSLQSGQFTAALRQKFEKTKYIKALADKNVQVDLGNQFKHTMGAYTMPHLSNDLTSLGGEQSMYMMMQIYDGLKGNCAGDPAFSAGDVKTDIDALPARITAVIAALSR
jgi:hypothetical protein